MRFQSYFNTAIKIIQLYDGTVPLQHYLKQYFSQHKKHGSKDRKFITHLCYGFYRIGKAFTDKALEEKLKIAIFICNDQVSEWRFLYDEDWLDNWSDSLNNRIALIQTKYISFSLTDVFPFVDDLSEGIDTSAFIRSFFNQPDVFIRVRPGYYEDVISKLRQHNISFNVIDENCISLSPFININSTICIDKEAVIQDQSSQNIKRFLKIISAEFKDQKSQDQQPEIITWDCCAGSGGKSILAYDILYNISLTVSDIRTSVIQNLKQRFAKAGIKNYRSFIADITNSKLPIANSKFDLIICDAPCTGSGTWSRTPEQLYFFQHEKISTYPLLQQKIVSHAIPSLKTNGYFLYITCSVFKKENEDITDFIIRQFDLELVKKELLKGYDEKADTMFAALFRKNS
jgi:16S rRNA (cytosine967-C5)-methyltransferase